MSVKHRTWETLFSVVLVLAMVFGVLPVQTAHAEAATVFVRTGGDDVNCNGSADVDFDAAVAPACALKTVQKGIELAVAGDTIQVAAGEYVESGQILITKNLTILGAGKDVTIIKPAQDTGSSGDSQAWIASDDNVNFVLKHVTLDGEGKNIFRGLRLRGTARLEDNIIKNISYPGYMGIAISLGRGAIADASFEIVGNTISGYGRVGIHVQQAAFQTTALIENNTIIGKGTGDWVNYAVEVESGAGATITRNMISNNLGVASTDGSGSAGLLATTYFAPGTNVALTENVFDNNTQALAIGYLENDTTTTAITHNNFANNEYTIVSTGSPVNAIANYWGDTDAAAIGAKVYGPVSYAPWLCSGTDTDANTPGFQPDTTCQQPLPTLTIASKVISAAYGETAHVLATAVHPDYTGMSADIQIDALITVDAPAGVDLSEMEISGKVNGVDIGKVKVGADNKVWLSEFTTPTRPAFKDDSGITYNFDFSFVAQNNVQVNLPVNVTIVGALAGDFDQPDKWIINVSDTAKYFPGISPAYGSIVKTRQPVFTWRTIEGVSRYQIQISSREDFKRITLGAVSKVASYEMKRDLKPGVYFWRVRTIGIGGIGPWSTVMTFTVQANAPTKPVLTSPASNSIVKNFTPELKWKVSRLPVDTTFGYYEVEVSADKTFGQILITGTTAVGDITDAHYVIPDGTLAPRTIYYWRVRSYNSAGEYSGWSTIRRFRTPEIIPFAY